MLKFRVLTFLLFALLFSFFLYLCIYRYIYIHIYIEIDICICFFMFEFAFGLSEVDTLNLTRRIFIILLIDAVLFAQYINCAAYCVVATIVTVSAAGGSR